MDISVLEASFNHAVESALLEIKAKSSTYAEALALAREIDWPKERPSRVAGKLLSMVRFEVERRLGNEFLSSVEIQK